jgi:hypothetical protein
LIFVIAKNSNYAGALRSGVIRHDADKHGAEK